MSKFFLRIFIVILAPLVLCIFFISGCKNVDFSNNSIEYVSEYRKNLFMAKSNTFLATLTSGEREENYAMEGSKSNLVDFGVLTISFETTFDTLPQFELNINDKKYTGEMQKNPFDNTFVFDIETQLEDSSEVILYIVDLDETVKLVNVSSSWNTRWTDALNIFNEKYKNELAKHVQGNVFLGEFYIKIVSNNSSLDNIYWYVLCVCQNGEVISCLIDPVTKIVLQS